jgi:hypothetical protein
MHPAAAHLKPFTSESARAAALKGVAIRRKRKEEKIRAQAEENQQRLEDAQTTLPADSYLAKRLARVREQLDRLDAMMLDERDPQKLSWLATCTAKRPPEIVLACHLYGQAGGAGAGPLRQA